jgi:nitrogen fixation-related uncharacterized protein
LYACGFAATFLYLEAGTLVDDFREIGMLFDGRILAFMINFAIDSFHNTVGAFMWPVKIAQFESPWGAIGLGAAFVAFPIFLKKPIERWLFSDAPETKSD